MLQVRSRTAVASEVQNAHGMLAYTYTQQRNALARAKHCKRYASDSELQLILNGQCTMQVCMQLTFTMCILCAVAGTSSG
jgi:hypothetical protein